MVGDQHGDPADMIVLCTDFGLEGPYTGQVKAVLARAAPAVPVVDLFADLPPFRPQGAAYLLAAYGEAFLPGDVILAVVDPGVGGARAALALEADDRWYVGPDNGIFELVLRRAQAARCWRVEWRPPALSATSTAVICSRRWRHTWRWARPRQGRKRPRCAFRTGRTICPKPSTSIATATP
jgi:S-adenosyl-l-methionine hydroxide adenosyltransferase